MNRQINLTAIIGWVVAIIAAIVGALLGFYLSEDRAEARAEEKIVLALSGYIEEIEENMSIEEAMKALAQEIADKDGELDDYEIKLSDEYQRGYLDGKESVDIGPGEDANLFSGAVPLVDALSPYQEDGFSEISGGKTVELGGVPFGNGFVLRSDGFAMYNLQGQYTIVSGQIGPIRNGDYTVAILGDDVTLETIVMKAGDLAVPFSVEVIGVSKFEIRVTDGPYGSDAVGLGEIMLS